MLSTAYLDTCNTETSKSFQIAISELLAVVLMKMKLFWNTTSFQMVNSYRCFTAFICLDRLTLNTEALGFCEISPLDTA
jgi:hypothetical protein